MLHIIYEFAYDVYVFRIQMMKKWYAVYIGKVPGVYEHWEDCLKQVNKFEGNNYKGYKTKEAEAQWRRSNGMRTGYIVIPLFLIVTAVLLYLIVG